MIDRRKMEVRARSILQGLGLEIDLHRLVRELRTAERQIVEIARALTTNPAALILDEPTSSLDRNEVERDSPAFCAVCGRRVLGSSLFLIGYPKS